MRLEMRQRRSGAGFTLIELLVVISIIAVLAALIAAAVGRVQAGQKQRRTEQNMVKIASALDQQWQAVIDLAKKDQEPLKSSVSLIVTCNNDRERAQVIWVKMRLLLEFPQNFSEARNYINITDVFGANTKTYYKQNYIDYLGSASATTASASDQSAVCLYMVLTQAREGMAAFDPEKVVPGAVATRNVGGVNFKVFVDDWGNPITFVRWPIGSAELNQAPFLTNPNKPDPQDPNGKLIGFSNSSYESFLHPFNPPKNLVPVVISAGPDKQFGIDFNPQNSLTTQTASQESDNLYSYRLRQDGGRGN